MLRLKLLSMLLLLVLRPALSQVAATPPMGWNSWDSYGLTITEAQFQANVQVQAKQLLPFGWKYAVIDEGWFLENPEARPHPEQLMYSVDTHGRYTPVPARFPSAGPNRSFKALGEYVHAQGLQFGIHIVRGVPRVSVARKLPIDGSTFSTADAADVNDVCPWDPTNWGVRDNAAGQAWYDSLIRQYADWGVDLLKVDCISDHPYKAPEIRMIHTAIQRAGRPMVLSLSPGPTALTHAEEVGKLAQMWRISDDVWDEWFGEKEFPQSIKGQFTRLTQWNPYARPGNWPDADMLAIGELRPSPGYGSARRSKLTPDEQQTMLTLWAIARSPLILGANLTLLDPTTLRLLTNRDLIAVNQTATASRPAIDHGDVIVWTADLPNGREAMAIFNRSDAARDITQSYAEAGLKGVWRARDAWTGDELARAQQAKVSLPAHGSVLLTLSH